MAGAELTYSVSVQNHGPATATGVVVTDQLPVGMSYVSDTGGCVEAPAGTLTCALPDLPSGGSLNFTITVLLEADLAAGALLVNDAVVDGTTADPEPSNNEDDAPVSITRDSDLVTSKSDQVDPVAAGEQLTYTVQVQNLGPSDAANVVVVDTLPAGTIFVSSTGGCVEAPAGTLTCALGDLADGASTSFEIVVTVDAAVADGTVLVNMADADSDSDDSNPGDNSDSESTTVEAVADVRLTKTALDTAPLAGTSFAFTIDVVNGGPSVATDVAVVDSLPAGLSYVSDTGGCVEAPADTLTCNLGDLAPGASTSFNVVVAVDASVADGTIITNTATVSTTADDPDGGNDSDDASVTVGTEADLAIDKTAPANAEPGQQIAYSLVVDNNGPSDAVGVRVTDTLPAEVTYLNAVGATCVEGPAGTVVCDVGTIPAGGQVVITIHVDIDGGVPDMTVITNGAEVGSDTDDPDPGDNDDDADTTVEFRNEADLRPREGSARPDAGRRRTLQLPGDGLQRRPAHGDQRPHHRHLAGRRDLSIRQRLLRRGAGRHAGLQRAGPGLRRFLQLHDLRPGRRRHAGGQHAHECGRDELGHPGSGWQRQQRRGRRDPAAALRLAPGQERAARSGRGRRAADLPADRLQRRAERGHGRFGDRHAAGGRQLCLRRRGL